MNDKKIYSLYSVAKSVEHIINEQCNRAIWIKAEIIKLNYYEQTGHCYPDLVEKREGKIVAEFRGTIWKTNLERINKTFKAILHEPLHDNITVVMQATIKYHPTYGLTLQITDIDPSYTLGELERQKQQCIQQLKENGFFTLNKEKKMPLLPKNWAIISVETSKGYQDFRTIITTNTEGYCFHTTLFPALLQGEKAVSTISAGLHKIEESITDFDAVAIIRGGGGEVGLSVYNNYELCQRIATFPIPVVTGIGHSTNETVAELVSWQSFITPSKMGEFLLHRFGDFQGKLHYFEQRINHIGTLLCSQHKQHLNSLSSHLNLLIKHALKTQHQVLGAHAKTLTFTIEKQLKTASQELLQWREKIALLDPIHVLKRGYSITKIDGKVVKTIDNIAPNTLLETTVADGIIKSKTVKNNP